MVFLFFISVFIIFICILIFSKIRIEIINFKFTSMSEKHLNEDYKIILSKFEEKNHEATQLFSEKSSLQSSLQIIKNQAQQFSSELSASSSL